MKITGKLLCIFILFLLILVSCGPKVDKELKRWERLTAELRKEALIYPAYANAFNSQLEIWTGEWESVLLIEDEKERAKAMDEVNDEVNWIMGKIWDFKSLQDDILELPEDIMNQLAEYSAQYPELGRYQSRLPVAEQKGLDSITNAVNIVRNTVPRNYDEAYTAFSNAVMILKDGRKDLYELNDDIDSYIRKKQESEEK